MATSNSEVHHQQQQQHYQHQHLEESPFICVDCGRQFNSRESLEVHYKYHPKNLIDNWASGTTASLSEETNNNTKANSIKREFIPNNSAASADNSESGTMVMKKSPDYSRTTPETILGHPPTPQSYHSGSSPYQNHHDGATFSPSLQPYQTIKVEQTSPTTPYHGAFNNFGDSQYFSMENTPQQYAPELSPLHKVVLQGPTFRYHPYHQQQQQQQQHSPYNSPRGGNSQVPSSPVVFSGQPTPSPTPKQCDKCGLVCESDAQLSNHISQCHPAASSYQDQHFMYGGNPIKTEDDAQSEILDLDSHKVHQVYSEEEKRQNGELNGGHNAPHSVNSLLWAHQPGQPKMYSPEQRMYMNQIHGQDFIGSVVTTSNHQDSGGVVSSMSVPPPMTPQTYRSFDHLTPQPTNPVISSSQVTSNQPQGSASPAGKSTNWKSNEARRPKTYNCTACNKWFTSSGHLKRHYNTTLHKNAVKANGGPDPATMPISQHHHPARESSSNKEDANTSPGEDDTNSMPSTLLQQPPSGPYDRQPPPPNIHQLHTPMPHNNNALGMNPANLSSNGSPPNGEAGLSPTTSTNLDSRGLLSLNTTATTTPPNIAAHHPGYGMVLPQHMMPMENTPFQMYPNESAPHVTPITDIIKDHGEVENQHFHHHQQQHQETVDVVNTAPLPSFASLGLRYSTVGADCDIANVGGRGLATAPYSYTTDYYIEDNAADAEPRMSRVKLEEDDFEGYMVLKESETAAFQNQTTSPQYSPEFNGSTTILTPYGVGQSPPSPEEAHIKRDFEEVSEVLPVVTSSVSLACQTGGYRCTACDKFFNKACYLTQHNQTCHSGEKPHKCNRCGKRFSSDEAHQKHSLKHAGDKPHKCDRCPKQFNHKTDLRRHMCLHTGKKPFTCENCGKGFIRKDHMVKHYSTHFKKGARANPVR